MRSQQFQDLVDRNPENELHRFSLAQALQREGRSAEAEPHYRFCCARRADWMVPRILLGKLLLAAGRTAEARPLLEEALRLAREQHHEDPATELEALLEEMS